MSSTKAIVSTSPADPIGALLTAEELAKHLKIKTSRVQKLRHRHGLPYISIGGEPRFDPRAVRAWLDQRAKSPAAAGAQS